MSLSVRSITIDCADPYTLARWWCQVFGVEPWPEDFPDDPAAICFLGEGTPRLLFERVPEAKAVKNRVHIDIAAGMRRDEEVARIIGLGATLFADFRAEDGSGFVVLADPDGNEFCIEQGPTQVAAGAAAETP
ncbi:MAG TPA: VOC family protein [Acidimicrobiales bacterium]|jgi:catechol 2,3-dioxygenase-like lactoylglutathione lyase family enzyme|nr:VOC family protein [Acidimicrobiales bacterium]